jgi:hypothetical protein
VKSSVIIGVFSAAVMTLAAIIVVGTTRWELAARVAECMAKSEDVISCRVPMGFADIGLVLAVIAFALVGFVVGVSAYYVGRRGWGISDGD